MLTTTSETLGSAKASVLRRVTDTTFLHCGFLIRSCTMRPPTFPVAPSTIAEYCAFASGAAVAIVTSHESLALRTAIRRARRGRQHVANRLNSPSS
jgi:hypothetical protein